MSRRFRRHGSAGFGLLETLIALSIMVIVVAAVTRLQKTIMKGTRNALDISGVARGLFAVQADITQQDRFLPAQEFPDDADPLRPETLDPYVDNMNIAARRCYSVVGIEVKSDPAHPGNCIDSDATYFRIQYVKFRQPDISFYVNRPGNPQAAPNNSINRIPLGHYRMRIDYAPDAKKQMQKKLYLSRYVTSTIVY